MTVTLALAIYGALISTALAGLRGYELWKAQRFVEIKPAFTYSGQIAYYCFVISNVSSGDVTLLDCMVESLSRDQYGELQFDWGMAPKIITHIWADDKDAKAFEKPLVLKSGEALFVEVDSLDLVRRFEVHSQISISYGKKWVPTENMQLTIEHSRSKHPVTARFKLENNEYDPMAYEAKFQVT